MALWLASFVVLGIVIIGVHAYLAQDEGLLTLRDAMPMALTSLIGAAWIYRSFAGFRLVTWGVTVALLVIGLFTAWHGMQDYPFQSLEQAFTRTLFTGDNQEGTSSRGGYTVGIDPEAQMAQYIKEHIHTQEHGADRQRADLRRDPAQRPAAGVLRPHRPGRREVEQRAGQTRGARSATCSSPTTRAPAT